MRRLDELTVHWLLNTLLLIVGLWIGLACGGDTDDRMVASVRQMHDGHQHHPASPDVSSALGTVPLSAEAMEERLRGQLERGSSPWGRSGPTTPATANRSWRELREERGRKALGRGAVRIKMVPARLNAKYAIVATESVAMGVDWMAGATTRGRMMRRIRNREGPKRGDENRHRAGGKNPRTEWFT